MARCRVCGRSLGIWGWLRASLRPRGFPYPVRCVDGSRSEKIVRWICARCEARAVRIRTAGELDEDLERQVGRRKLFGR